MEAQNNIHTHSIFIIISINISSFCTAITHKLVLHLLFYGVLIISSLLPGSDEVVGLEIHRKAPVEDCNYQCISPTRGKYVLSMQWNLCIEDMLGP